MFVLKKEINLGDAGTIDNISEDLVEALTTEGIDRGRTQRIRLSLEEVLLRWRESDPLGGCVITLKRQFGNLHLEVIKQGACFDPFVSDDSGDENEISDKLISNLLANLGVGFKYSYFRDINCVSLVIKKKESESIIPLVIAIVASISLGLFLIHFAPRIAEILHDEVFTPLFDAFIGVLKAVVGPFVLLSVTWGIYSMSIQSNLGRVGKSLFGRLIIYGILTGVTTGIILSFFVSFTGQADDGSLEQPFVLFQMLLEIVPGNFVETFLHGNALQIVFIAVVFGFILTRLRCTSYHVITLVGQLNDIFKEIIGFFGFMMPGFVFISVLNLILSGELSKFTEIWLLFVVILIIIVVFVILQLFEVVLRVRISPFKFLKKISKPFFTAITTASSVAALPSGIECCEKKLGIHSFLVKLGLPMGIIIFAPGTIIVYCVVPIFFTVIYDIPITISQFVIFLITALILSVAAPPVQASGIVIFPLLLSRAGVPLEVLPLAIAIDFVTDYIATACNNTSLNIQLLNSAKQLDLLDRKILKKKN